MIDQLYPVQPGSITSPVTSRRLPTGWLWLIRGLWAAVFLLMVTLNILAIAAHIERDSSGITGGASGLRAEANEQGEWVLAVDPSGPAAQAGIAEGDRLLAIDGVELAPDAAFGEVNRRFFGSIGDARALTVQGSDGTVRQVEFTLVGEDTLQTWRRFRVPMELTGGYLIALEAILLAGYLLTSALIFVRRSDDWLALYLTLTLMLVTPQLSYSWYYLGLTAAFWDEVFVVLISVAVALTLPNFYLLPNGRFVPRWTLYLTIVWVVWCVGTEVFPEAPFSLYRTSGATQLLVWLAWFATGMLAQVYRYRYEATPTEQQQIKWLAFGLTVAVVVNLGWTLAFELFPILVHAGPPHRWMWWIGRPIYVLGMMMLPISFGIAVFRYRLWDIDNLINRTLVYGTLTVIVVGVYVVVVAVFEALFGPEGQLFSQIIAITLDLIIFAPLRERLQASVDRLMFGASEDLPTVVSKLGQRLGAALGPEEVLPTIVETLAESLHLPYVAVALRDGDGYRIAATNGTPVAAYYTWPLVYQRQAVGQLILAPRSVGESLKANDWQLVEQVSYHISVAVHDLLLEYALHPREEEAQQG